MKKIMFKIYIVRLIVGLFFFIRGHSFFLFNQIYRGTSDLCWVYRVSRVSFLKKLAMVKINKIVSECMGQSSNVIVESFLKTQFSRLARERYSIDGPGSLDIFRDIIILKLAQDKEKGVILIKYGETYDAFVSYFKVKEILKKYYIVLEMSWAGACDPSFLMFMDPENHVIVQTPEKDDFLFVEGLDSNLVSIKLGSGDWVDPDSLKPDRKERKQYDIVMVANWGTHKNHRKLFKALNNFDNGRIKLVLVGFPWGDRTLKDIKNDFEHLVRKNRSNVSIEYFESLPFNKMQEVVQRSKCSLLLSEKEGGNKSITESLFLGVPIIVYNKHIGGSLEKVNEQTGVDSSFQNLKDTILYMKKNYRNFNPRKWALEHTGTKIASKILNEKLKRISKVSGQDWTYDIVEKINAPNLEYKNEKLGDSFKEGYNYILSKLR